MQEVHPLQLYTRAPTPHTEVRIVIHALAGCGDAAAELLDAASEGPVCAGDFGEPDAARRQPGGPRQLTMTALSPADDSGMSTGKAKEDEEPIGLVDTQPGLVDGHGLMFLQPTRSRASSAIQHHPIRLKY
jgi:hypothetical protein